MSQLAPSRPLGPDDHWVPAVALVDDHRIVLDGLAAAVRASGADLDLAVVETSWTRLLDHPRFPVDVVVLDLGLGDVIPIATKIRVLASAGCATVVMSRHADGVSIRSAIAAGALAFVAKTDSVDDLIVAVHSAARGESTAIEAVLGEVRRGRAQEVAAPQLGLRERRAASLYASGFEISEVAFDMGTTEETIRSYIKRARHKYRENGVDVGTRTLLRRRALEEGWLARE